ncbi:Transcriptional regulator, LysR family [Bosea sp. LC85]|uniref:LysR family transcriptional regulator n=1 Tax=Bosea sp. LC85 TaxID=1502851 RepID=UPI0004E3B69F|nr:LysR substrate-binding domain-containing protein [Bosea sp. LC85]KFC72749.1 Transcriptional regulator, LysR family [Bosea sp. LC85]
MIIRQLVYLDALAREKHFRRAAEACHVSQPTLSTAIGQLEEELGVLIVERGRRFQGLTKEGEVVLAHARRILAEADLLKESIVELKQGVSGRIRLGAIPTALPMIAHITAPFSERYPTVSLTVLSLTSAEIQSRIDNFELDVGVTYLDNEPLDRVISKPIYQESYVLLTREDGALGGQDTITWAEAAELKLCLLTADMQNRRIIDGIFRSVGHAPRPAIETNSIFNLCSHAGIQGVSSIVSLQLLEFFGVPLGTKALPLVEPDAKRTIGLIVADRQPFAPLTRNLLMMSHPISEAGLPRLPIVR